MRFKIVSLIAVAGLVAACSTAPTEETAATSGEGDTMSGGASTTAEQIEAGTQRDLVVNVGDRVFFAFDRSDLRPEARFTLQKQAAWLKANPGVNVLIEGHCDERGTREYNLALGERRANSAADFLMSLGVSADRIDTISYGKERPVDPRSDEEAWAKNRRAVAVVQ